MLYPENNTAVKILWLKFFWVSLEEIEKNKHLYRSELIKLGNEGRAKADDFWLSKLSNMDKIIVPDVRVQFEADFFRKIGAFLVRINSDYEKRAVRGTIVNKDDLTETALDNYEYWNVVVKNNSDLLNLEYEACNVVKIFNEFLNNS